MAKKSIFITIPKNASHSICKFVGTNKRNRSKKIDNIIPDNHARAIVILKRYGLPEFNKRIKFTFVRNPWSRCVSWYNFHKKMNLYPYTSMTFEQWVMKDLPHHWNIQNGTNYRQLKISPLHQHVFIMDNQGNSMMNFIGKIENMNQDIIRLCKILGKPIPKNLNIKLNKSGNVDYRKFYNDKTRKKVAEILKKDIQLFNYEF